MVSDRPLTGRAVFRSVLRNHHPGLVLRGRIVLFFVADTSGRPVAAVSRKGFGAARRGLFSGVESSYFLWLTLLGDPLRWFSVKGSVRLAGCCSPGAILRDRIVLFFVADTSGRPVAAVSREEFGAARRGLFSGVGSSYFLWLTFRGDPLRLFPAKGSVLLSGCCSPGAALRGRIVLFFVADISGRPLRPFAGAGGFSGSELRIVQVPLFVA